MAAVFCWLGSAILAVMAIYFSRYSRLLANGTLRIVISDGEIRLYRLLSGSEELIGRLRIADHPISGVTDVARDLGTEFDLKLANMLDGEKMSAILLRAGDPSAVQWPRELFQSGNLMIPPVFGAKMRRIRIAIELLQLPRR